MFTRMTAWAVDLRRRARDDDRGYTTETVVIAAGLATLAIAIVAAVTAFADGRISVLGG
jgi:hypothetical protein